MMTHPFRCRLSSQRGGIAVISLFFMAIALVMVAALASETVVRSMAVRKNVQRDQALAIAEAGADYVANMLKANPGYAGTNGTINFGQGSFSATTQSSGGNVTATVVGELPSGVTSSLMITCVSGGSFQLPNGAIVANGSIAVNGQGNTSTMPSSEHQASILANGNVTLSGQSIVDGYASAHGTVTMNGQASAYLGKKQGVPLVDFPSAQAIDTWQESLKSKAMQGTTITSGTVNKNTTLTSPVYIKGNLNITSKATLTINGGGVVYVEGSITISGQSKLVNSGVLAARDQISCSGQSIYTVSNNTSSVALVSFHGRSGGGTSIDITGQSSTNPMGIVYAANGDIKVSGQGDIYGALVAGGVGSKGNVMLTGQGNVYYPADLLKEASLVPGEFKVQSWVEK